MVAEYIRYRLPPDRHEEFEREWTSLEEHEHGFHYELTSIGSGR